MNKEFIPYEQALALKELGFNKPCLGIYYGNEKNFIISETLITNSELDSYNSPDSEITTPLKSQVFKWFRDKYNIVHTVYSNASGYIWELHYNKERGGTHICDSEESGDCELSGMFTTYKGAESACLKKLIEIVKNKRDE
jgi:hypothetical protein